MPGLTTTENSCCAAAGRGGRGGAAGGGAGGHRARSESASSELTLPLPVLAGVAREVLPAGAVQGLGSVEDFSLQELTSQEPACATATEGVVWLVAGGGAGHARRGGDRRGAADRCGRPRRDIVSLIVALPATVTVVPESAATACLVHARPRVEVPSLLWMQRPAGGAA